MARSLPVAEPPAEPRDGMDRVVGIGVVIAVVAAVVAAATIWLLLTDPVTVATTLETGDVSPLVRQLADVIYNAIAGLLSYL
jgi:hypothetical protein